MRRLMLVRGDVVFWRWFAAETLPALPGAAPHAPKDTFPGCWAQRYSQIQTCPVPVHGLGLRCRPEAKPGSTVRPEIGSAVPLHSLGVDPLDLHPTFCSFCFLSCRQAVLSQQFCLLSPYVFELTAPRDTPVLLPHLCLARWPPSEAVFIVKGVVNHPDNLNVNVSVITVLSQSRRSWVNTAMPDGKQYAGVSWTWILENKWGSPVCKWGL